MSSAPTHIARCSCGQLQITCDGDPVRVSICHCIECQRRTGSAFGAQARFAKEATRPQGTGAAYLRTADSGSRLTFTFCPSCGSTLWWEVDTQPGIVAVALGNFLTDDLRLPMVSVYDRRRRSWVALDKSIRRED